jgi:hypothetical protein
MSARHFISQEGVRQRRPEIARSCREGEAVHEVFPVAHVAIGVAIKRSRSLPPPPPDASALGPSTQTPAWDETQ